MLIFVEGVGRIPLPQIKRVFTLKSDGVLLAHVETLDGSKGRTDLYLDDLEKLFLPVIPAAPGYEMLFDYENGEFGRAPIIAWRVDRTMLHPVTLENADPLGGILRPDGKVEQIGIGIYDSPKEWLEEMKELRALEAAE